MSINVNCQTLTKSLKALLDMKKKAVEMNVKSDLYNVPIMLHGKHGIGKSAIVKQFAKDNNMNCVVLNLANQSPEDLLGQIDGKGGYYTPDWVVTDSNKNTVYFLDELNRAPTFVLQCMFNFILEGRIHQTHIVKDNDMIISACNPPTENYNVIEFDDDAFSSRFAHFILTPTKEEVVEYFNGLNLKNKVIQTVLSKSKVFNDNDISIEWKGSTDNRNLERCALMMEFIPKTTMRDIGSYLFASLLGYDGAQIVMGELNNEDKISFEDLLNGKRQLKKDQIDDIHYVNMTAVDFLKDKIKDDSLKKSEIDFTFKYMKSLPKDNQVAFLNLLSKSKIDVSRLFSENKTHIEYVSDLLLKVKSEEQEQAEQEN